MSHRFCAILLLFYSIPVAVATGDPCLQSNHFNLTDLWRNVHYTSAVANFECDNSLDTAWYRFITDDGVMPTYPVDRGYCGTMDTIWVNGALPDINSITVTDLTVCANTAFGTCDQTWTIKAKGCGTYYVYYLVPTMGCDMAYCVDCTSTTTPTPTSTTAAVVVLTTASKTSAGTTTNTDSVTANDVKGCSYSSWQIAVIILLVLVLLVVSFIAVFLILQAVRRNRNNEAGLYRSTAERLPSEQACCPSPPPSYRPSSSLSNGSPSVKHAWDE